MRIVILGAQGSGKGTQAELLSKKLGVPHIDAGQLLREEIAKKTVFGKSIEGLMRRGELLPHKLIDDFMQKRLSQPDCRDGFVLDGYPRHLEEAEFLDSIEEIDAVVFLQVPDELVFERVSKRRVCKKCLMPVYGSPGIMKTKCGKCRGTLVQREDDKPKALERRLRIYHEVTEPLIEYYKPRSIVRVIDASGSVRPVFKKILEELGE
jgi:adenylate kinase